MKIGNRFMVVRGWREDWGVSANGYRVPIWGEENILELDSGGNCTMLAIY